MAKVWTMLCVCGHDEQYEKLADAKKDGRKHLGHDPDGQVLIDEVETDPAPFDDYLTGRTITLTK